MRLPIAIDIYRLGYYAGLGARKVATVTPSVSLPQNQPACLTDATTGLVDCGNWAVSASWAVPATATSGIYIGKLVRPDTGGSSHMVFVVRDDTGQSDILLQTSDTTWQAYNDYGGNSLYSGAASRPRVQGELQPAVHGPRQSIQAHLVVRRRIPDGAMARSQWLLGQLYHRRRHRSTRRRAAGTPDLHVVGT